MSKAANCNSKLKAHTWKRDAKSWNPSSLLPVILRKTFICIPKTKDLTENEKKEEEERSQIDKKQKSDAASNNLITLPCKVKTELAL